MKDPMHVKGNTIDFLCFTIRLVVNHNRTKNDIVFSYVGSFITLAVFHSKNVNSL